MGPFHVALLRILVKRHDPVRLSHIVRGFPDSTDDYVLGAVSELVIQGFVVRSGDYVSLAESRRREALQVVQFGRAATPAWPTALSDSVKNGRAKDKQLTPLLSGVKTRVLLVASLAIIVIASALGSTLQSTASDLSQVYYWGQPGEQHWTIVESSGEPRILSTGHSYTIYIIHEWHEGLAHALND